MSPSLASSDSHGGRSNTSSPSDPQRPNHTCDALPMITSHFDFPVAASGRDSLSFRDSVPQLLAPWSKLASPLARSASSEHLRGLTASLAGGCTTPSGSFASNLAVPAPLYGRAGTPLHLTPSNSQNDLGTLDGLCAAFLLTRSRAVKVRKHPGATFLSLRSIFEFLDDTNQADNASVGPSLSMWRLKDLSAPDDAWVVFKSHHDAYIFLSLSLPSFTIFPALEIDLEPFEKLSRFDVFSRFPSLPVIQPESKSHRLRMSISTPDFHSRLHVGQHTAFAPVAQTEKFVISSNPPNPRTTFRVGDWICNSVTCAAHNFGRNLACRGCGCPRSENQASSMNRQILGMPSTRLPTSPRFASTPGTAFYTGPNSIPNSSSYPAIHQGARSPLAAQPIANSKPASPSHPLLTPSGRSFSVGGKVQNISSDPTMPCIMYWPDNEPLPERGQIRPTNLVGVQQPPILNTGNRGPIEHQPGDWICQKCNYLNWRRRKVCQTCYPYAEGNGDSISAAVQSERINLLTSLLAQDQLPLRTTPSTLEAPRRNTQVQHQRPPEAVTPLSLSRSQVDLRTATQYPDPQFIYETSGPHRRAMHAFPGMKELEDALSINAPVPLLPSFLQDIVQSPTLSPTSTSSADLSIEEYEDAAPSPRAGREQVVARDESAYTFSLGNIWRFNGEETTNIAGIALPHHEDLVGSRKSSQEILRRQSP
ncbi:hypothetical protein JVT61DRAFT_11098 [Boletus reticuloceps]|uniref:RanBP2-type domain-containing protein n=1 Tax=Boletus reticuloceps TaxID=495285 RepID=A0A8I2YF36_9AGAM|nr:hypothetical protein JVT61DRAFT_11098 [Boletus reticuloceps]